MAFALVANATAQAASNATTSAIDTTGANLLVVAITWYAPAGAPTVQDSKGNTWTALTSKTRGDGSTVLYYSVPTSVGTGHTFTAAGSGKYATICAAAFSGGHASAPYEAESAGGTVFGTSVQPGTLTPAENNELLVTGIIIVGPSSAESVNSGLAVTNLVPYSAGVSYGGALSYKVQTTAGAENPTWSWTSTNDAATVMACFRAASVAAPPRSSNLLLMGVS